MMIVRPVPADLERRSLPERLRFWAQWHGRVRDPNLRLMADLEEAATEIELGQRTPLTYRGDVIAGVGAGTASGDAGTDAGA